MKAPHKPLLNTFTIWHETRKNLFFCDVNKIRFIANKSIASSFMLSYLLISVFLFSIAMSPAFGQEKDLIYSVHNDTQKETSQFSARIKNTTYRADKNALLSESFDTWPPHGWTIEQIGSATGNWQSSSDTYSGAGAAFHGWDYQNFNSWLISPAITIPAGEEYMLSFWEKNQYMGNWYDYSGVLISTGSNTPGHEDFTEVYESNISIAKYTQKYIDLSSFSGQTIYIAFVYQGNDAHIWWVDELQIQEKRFDYRTRQSGNWNDTNRWLIFDYNTGNWRNATTADGYPGQNRQAGTVTIQNNHNIVLNVSPPYPITQLEIEGGNEHSYVTFQDTNSLTVMGLVQIFSSSRNNRHKYINLGAGTLNVGEVLLSETDRDNRDSYIQIGTGTVNVTNDITMGSNGLRTYILFTGNGTLNLGGTITGGNITSTNGGHNSNGPNTGTVNYFNAGDQQVGNYSYHNLHISNSGTKTLAGDISVNRDLNVSGSATLATSHFSITGNTSGQLALGNGSTLQLGNPFNGSNVQFPSHFTTANIQLHDNSTVMYQAGGQQTISSAPASYGRLTVSSDNSKNLQGNIRVNTRMLLDGAITALGNSNLTLGSEATIAGTFSSTNMIQTNGTGMLVKEGTQSSHFRITYPVGTQNVYSPMVISAFSASVQGTGVVRVNATGSTAPHANPTDLQRFWTTTTDNISALSTSITFHFAPEDLPEGTYEPAFHNGAGWMNVPGATMGTTSFSTSGAANLNGVWTAKETVATYYSYQSGNWQSTNTWTTDPSGTLHENPGIPGANDRVVILNGRTVSATSNNRSVTSVQINEGGVLDITNTSGHNFGDVSGQGLLRLQTHNFPSGNFNHFVSAQGGTVEYYDAAGDFNFSHTLYNNLIINFANTGRIVTATSNITINGDLTIRSGRFQINNNTATTARNITIHGSVLVESNGRIQVGTGNTSHNFVVHGDFSNRGTVRFTNQVSPNYTDAPPNGRADIIFNNPSSHQRVSCNGQTDFYRIIIDKGIDETYEVFIEASSPDNFALFGQRNFSNDDDQYAFSLRRGTARIGQNVDILLTHGGGNNYIIKEGSRLWVDGGSVEIPENGNQLGVTGIFRITDGVANCPGTGGIHLNNIGGVIQVEGGELNARVLRSSMSGGDQLGTYQQSGGVVTLSGPMPGGSFGRLSWWRPENRFIMSGGTLIVRNSGNSTDGIDIRSLPENISITGGTVIAEINDNRNFKINSRAPFWNLQLIKTSNGGGDFSLENFISGNGSSIGVQPLVIYQNLQITTSQPSASVELRANNNNVTVGGNFNITETAVYRPGNNTTTFNGTSNQIFHAAGTIAGNLHHMAIADNASLTLNGQMQISVNGNFKIGEGALFTDNGRTVLVSGNIENSGVHFKPVTGAGNIQLTGNAAQIVSGNGQGVFNNLFINKNGGSVTLTAPANLTGNLRMASAQRLFIGSHMLTLGEESMIYSSLTGNDQVFNANRMIVTNGLASDGGIRKEFSSTQPLLFPYGFRAANNTFYYLPSVAEFTQTPASWGSLRSRPVNERHHLAQGVNNSLRVYWKNQALDFEEIPPGAIHQRFYYENYFADGNQNNYIPAVYRSGTTWQVINDVNQVNQSTNVITFINQSNPTGDFTAGLPAAFENIPILYSRQDGLWHSHETWSAEAVGGAAAGFLPGANTIVVIGDEINQHTVNISQNNQSCGALLIATGSTLDLQDSHGHNFAALPEEVVTGAGTLRISRNNYFPAGDFGDFIGPNGGTVEYYITAGTITIPLRSASNLELNQYRNLVLNHGNGIINLPNRDLVIHEDLVLEGGNGSGRTNTGNNWNTLTVNGNVEARSGTFIIMEGNPKTLRLINKLNIASGATFRVRNSENNTNHTIEFWGDIINEGTFNLHQNNSQVSAIFRGLNNTIISGNGSLYNFYNIIVDKGHDATPVVSLESEITTGVSNPFLTLLNGTFRVNNEQLTVTITNHQSDFTIPSTAALSVEAGEVRVGYGNGNANLQLAGTLEIMGGSMYIGDPSANRHNSIEYAAIGQPRIMISGGELFVNSQIRRPSTTTSGVIHYEQQGGLVTISGKIRMQNRALLEILNDNSYFHMSDGELRFDRPSAMATTFGDIYIRPAGQSVTGGTLQMGLNNSTAGFVYRLSTTAPLWNVSIGTNNRHQILNNEVFAMEIRNNLIINGNSQFRANGFDVSIRGNLINENNDASAGINTGGYRPGSLTQTTTFTGNANRYISGVAGNQTNFAHLVIEKSANRTLTLQPESRIRVNGNLSLMQGTLHDGSNDIILAGNLFNQARHTSNSNNGGIILRGAQRQRLEGRNGILGNLIMDNSHGAFLTDNTTINGMLTFNTGSLYMDDYQLTFGIHASIGGTPDMNRMILLNGALSDLGIRKQLAAGASTPFTIPMGVSGKYTPVTLHVHSNPAPGSITLKPVNRRHPAVDDPENHNELDYYWSLEAEGLASADISYTLTYAAEDVNPQPTSHTNYVAAWFDIVNNQWLNLGDEGNPGEVNESELRITFRGTGFIRGDITAGFEVNFPTEPLPTFYSRNALPTAMWSNPAAWSTQGHDGPPADSAPHATAVIIAEGHTRTVNQNNQFTTWVQINGVLDLGQTLYHNLGRMFGAGKMVTESSAQGFFVLPGGNYDDFFATPTTILEFTGNNTASLPLKPGNFYKPYQNVIFSGGGQKIMSAEHMKILGDLTITQGATLSNTLHNKNLYIGGDWINHNTSENSFMPGTGTVFFEGNRSQQIKVNATERFYNLTMNNTAEGASLAGSAKGIEIIHSLTLTRGVLFSFEGREVSLFHTSSSTAVSGGNSVSFVDGPLRKRIIRGQNFNFPVGSFLDGEPRLGRAELRNARATASPAWWTAQYVSENPQENGYAGTLQPPLTDISNNEYWKMDMPEGGTAQVRVRWDENSFPGFTADPQLRSMLRLVEHKQSPQPQWEERGNVINGNAAAGNIISPASINGSLFSIGVIGVTASFADNHDRVICDNDAIASIPVTLTGRAPWSITYKAEGGQNTTFTQHNITSSPYLINLTGSNLGGAENGPYQLYLVSVSDAYQAGLVNESTVKIDVKLTHQPQINGAISVGSNETRIYTTPANAGSTYRWMWQDSQGGNITNSTSASANILFNQGIGIFTLVIEETSSTGCIAYDEITIVVSEIPVPAISPLTPNICIESSPITYSTPYNDGNEYRWVVTGGNCTGCNTWSTQASITVNWNQAGEGTVRVFERIGGSGPQASAEQNPLISPMPQHRPVSAREELICTTGETEIVIASSQAGFTYILRTGESNTGSSMPGNGGEIAMNTGAINGTTTFNVLATNLGCQLELNQKPTVQTIDPSVRIESDPGAVDGVAIICNDASASFSAVSENALQVHHAVFHINTIAQQSGAQLSFQSNSLSHEERVGVRTTVTGNCVIESLNSIEMIVGDGYWTGAGIDDNWNNPDNWSCNVPDHNTDVVISNYANQQMAGVLDANPSVRNIHIEDQATIRLEGGTLHIYGNYTQDGYLISDSHGTLEFRGNSEQQIAGVGNMTFSNLSINKDGNSSLSLTLPVEISHRLWLKRGRINTSSTAMLTLGASASSDEGINLSFVNGPMRKKGTDDYIFPTGKGQRLGRIGIHEIISSQTKSEVIFEAEYFTGEANHTGTYNLDEGLLLISSNEYWNVEDITGDINEANFSLHWIDNEFSNINHPETVRLVQFRDGMWHNHGPADMNLNFDFVKSSIPFSTFGQITFGSASGNNPFPIELLYFTARAEDDHVSLLWATASEINNDFFTIERSMCGGEFEPIAYLPSQAPYGNSNQTLSYQWEDTDPLKDIAYYRLKQTDYDGSFEYSGIVAVSFTQKGETELKVYPNPNRGDGFNLIASGILPGLPATLTITDMLGNRVYSQILFGDENGIAGKRMDGEIQLAPGVYLVSLTGEGFRETVRMVVR
ncbi:MAG: T9SS C-terminal target domain-containing protein [Bacteroidetes bacterium]|nr:MAG: T9SS C-terminal target domain-containing protein [Bacteroidota bacterium]